tara:strand:+ start:329 stop:499 length:171 start_codon:yes stop_codon:yes gene_type:complete
MSVPKKRITSSSKKQRASHFAIKKQNLIKCINCKTALLPHHACDKCGWYKGKKVIK